MPSLRFKRGTRAQLDAAAAAGQLREAEPYFITDEDVAAVGTGTGTYAVMGGGGNQITVSATAPASPTLNQLWLDIS